MLPKLEAGLPPEARQGSGVVYAAVGALEGNADRDMVRDLRKLGARLGPKRYPLLRTKVEVLDGETHNIEGAGGETSRRRLIPHGVPRGGELGSRPLLQWSGIGGIMIGKAGWTASVLALAFCPAAPSRGAAGGCHGVSGAFTAVSPANCPSFLCTHGRLTGDLSATYDFVATGLNPDGSVAGNSTITLDNGAVIRGNDTSVLNGDGTFVTTVRIAGGTRQYAHATGALVAPGAFTASGGTEGTYSGTICLGVGPG